MNTSPLNASTVLLAALVLSLAPLGAAHAAVAGKRITGSRLVPSAIPLATPVDRIVGMWQTEVTLFPCGGGGTPVIAAFEALGSFHAGGTLDNTDGTPPTSRGPGTGIWKNAGHGQYRARMQFMRYNPDGSFDGIQDISRTLLLSTDGRRMDETVVARVLNADGSLRAQVCGSGDNWRVNLD